MSQFPLVQLWRKAFTVLVVVAFSVMAYGVATASAESSSHGDEPVKAASEGHSEKGGHGGEEHGGEFDPLAEFKLARVIGPEMKVGAFDFSITAAVLYLWLALAVSLGFTVYVARRLRDRPDRKQTMVESLYEFTSNGIAGETLPTKVRSRYMPYVAALFVFIWTINIISFIPLPLNAHHATFFGRDIPAFALYAATSNINVTLTLTILTLLIAHYEGVRNNGVIGYVKSWAAGDTLGIKLFTWPLHAIGEAAKLISLSVRLFANMLGGHLLILVMLSLAGLIGSYFVLPFGVALGVAFFLFEVGIVVTVQAFIFAMLSGVYIGQAAEPHH